eukprot:3947607-Amphidinium_carterae.1
MLAEAEGASIHCVTCGDQMFTAGVCLPNNGPNLGAERVRHLEANKKLTPQRHETHTCFNVRSRTCWVTELIAAEVPTRSPLAPRWKLASCCCPLEA